jgi:propanediol utilization protein
VNRSDNTPGQYVSGTRPITQPGTFTSVPVTITGSYVSTARVEGPAGRYTQAEARRSVARTVPSRPRTRHAASLSR